MREKKLYFEPSEPGAPFHLNLLGQSWCDGSYHIDRRGFACYVFEYIIEGRGYLRVEEEKFYPEAGDVYIVPAGADHEYGSSADAPWVKVFFNAGGPLLRTLLESYRIADTVLFRQMPRTILELFESGIREISSHPEEGLKIAPAVLTRIIIELADQMRNRRGNYSPEGLELRRFLDRAVYRDAPSLDDAGAAIGRSPSQAIRIFRRDFGMTPYNYLLERKIETAKVMLSGGFAPVKKIAFDLGFGDVYYFSNLFKKKAGVSPLRYRERALAEFRSGEEHLHVSSKTSDFEGEWMAPQKKIP